MRLQPGGQAVFMKQMGTFMLVFVKDDSIGSLKFQEADGARSFLGEKDVTVGSFGQDFFHFHAPLDHPIFFIMDSFQINSMGLGYPVPDHHKIIAVHSV